MNFFYFVFAILLAQQVNAKYNDFLGPFYASEHWKKSLAFDAPVINPEETLEHLGALLELVPENKEYDYLRSQAKNMVDRDRSVDINVMHYDLTDLINIAKILDPTRCRANGFLFLYDGFGQKNSFTHQTERLPYGENMKAYLNYYRNKALDLCIDNFKNNISKFPAKDLSLADKLVEQILSEIKISDPRDVKSLINTNIIIENLAKLLVSLSSNGDRKELKQNFNFVENAVYNVLSTEPGYGFIDTIIDYLPSLVDKLTSDYEMRQWAIKIFLWKRINLEFKRGKIKFDDVIKAAGYSNDLRGKIKNLFH